MARRRRRVTKVIQASWWDKDEEVVIRKFSFGHRQAMANRYFEISTEVEEGEENPQVKTQMLLGNMNLAILEAGIVSWTLKEVEVDEEDNVVSRNVIPFSPMTIFELPEEDGDFMLEEINALNRPRDEEAQSSFRGTADSSLLLGSREVPSGGE